MERLFSIDQAAEHMGGLSRHTIAAYLRDRKIMRTKIGRRTMIRESELKKLAVDGQKSPIAAPARHVAQAA